MILAKLFGYWERKRSDAHWLEEREEALALRKEVWQTYEKAKRKQIIRTVSFVSFVVFTSAVFMIEFQNQLPKPFLSFLVVCQVGLLVAPVWRYKYVTSYENYSSFIQFGITENRELLKIFTNAKSRKGK